MADVNYTGNVGQDRKEESKKKSKPKKEDEE